MNEKWFFNCYILILEMLFWSYHDYRLIGETFVSLSITTERYRKYNCFSLFLCSNKSDKGEKGKRQVNILIKKDQVKIKVQWSSSEVSHEDPSEEPIAFTGLFVCLFCLVFSYQNNNSSEPIVFPKIVNLFILICESKQRVPLETKSEEDKHYDNSSFQNNAIALNSYHQMSINSNITTKMGPGPISYINERGNIQMMAMKQPENAVSDAGEYQMSAGCLFFRGDGHQIKINDKEYTVKGSVKYNLAVGVENMDHEGKLNGEEKAHAIAAIF